MAKRTTKEQPLKFIIYARKSTESADRQVSSLDAQLEVVRDIAKQNNYKVVKTFRESASAHKVHNRPKFDEMVKMIEDGKANAILCWHTNRLARNPLENGIIQQLLIEHKIQVIHTNDRIYRPEDCAILFSVEAGMNTEYSMKLSKDVRRGVRFKNRQGKHNCMAPQGYLNSRDKDNQPIIIPDPERFPIIKSAFRMYLTGNYSVPEVLSYLNNDCHYLTKKRKKIGGRPLGLTSLHSMFENPFYMGKVRDFDDPTIFHDGAWEPMITEEQYWRIQRMKNKYSLEHNLRPKVAVNAKNFELKGIMTCLSCGCSIIGEQQKKLLKDGTVNEHLYYRCTHKSKLRKCTLRGGIPEEEAFKQIYELLDSYTIHPLLYEWSMQMLKKIHAREIEERYDRAEMQHTSLEECEKERSRLLDMSLRGMVDDDLFETKDRQLRERIERIKEVSKDAQERNKNWYEVIGKTLETLRSPKEKMEAAETAGERRAILQAIGPEAKLVERKVGTYKNGRDLTKKFIEVKPYPWLEKLAKNAKKIAPEIDKGFNRDLQGENDRKSALYSEWWGYLDSNQGHCVYKTHALTN